MALLVMSSSIISAQEKVIHLDEVIVSSQEESEKAFGQLSNYIAFDDDFKYRYELRKSKLTNKVYYFPDTTIAKTQVLKHFKNAARKSDDKDAFVKYFEQKHLHYIDSLEPGTVSGIYNTMRLTTLNGYLDGLVVLGGWD